MGRALDLRNEIALKESGFEYVISLHKKAMRPLEEELASLERACQHNRDPQCWEERYIPDYQESYTIHGDKPGTMGVDWRGPVFVPAITTPKWTRMCKLCGKVEVTTRVQKEEVQKPQF